MTCLSCTRRHLRKNCSDLIASLWHYGFQACIMPCVMQNCYSWLCRVKNCPHKNMVILVNLQPIIDKRVLIWIGNHHIFTRTSYHATKSRTNNLCRIHSLQLFLILVRKKSIYWALKKWRIVELNKFFGNFNIYSPEFSAKFERCFPIQQKNLWGLINTDKNRFSWLMTFLKMSVKK